MFKTVTVPSSFVKEMEVRRWKGLWVGFKYSDRESNPDQRFRKPTFYPLNYQSEFFKLYFATVG